MTKISSFDFFERLYEEQNQNFSSGSIIDAVYIENNDDDEKDSDFGPEF